MNGFSTNTCLPFSRAAFASSKCVHTGVTTATASMSGDRSTSESVGGELHARDTHARARLSAAGFCRTPRPARSRRARSGS